MDERARAAAAAFSCLMLVAGCGSTGSDSVRADVLRGIAQIRGSHDAKKLRDQLIHTLANLRRDHASMAADRKGKRLALQGFAWTRRGVEAQIAFYANDSGNIEAATRDAKKADRSRKRGANLLRAAGRALGVTVGRLKDY